MNQQALPLLLSLSFASLTACAGIDDDTPTKEDVRSGAIKADLFQDFCEELGWYDDKVCDTFCPKPDPDCQQDFCEEHGWYDDKVCDTFCPKPDPDCQDDGDDDDQDPDEGDGDDQDPDEGDDSTACSERSGGAMVVVGSRDNVGGKEDQVKLWITNSSFIDVALSFSGDTQAPRFPFFSVLKAGKDCDEVAGWHVDSANVEFADFAAEVCDAVPSWIADNLDFVDNPGYWCPWSGYIVSVEDRR